MKKALIILFLIFCGIQLQAQSFDFSVLANGGLSHEVGKSTVNSTFLNADASTHTGYANGDGNTLAFSYGAGFQFQYTFKCDFILGAQTVYEVVSIKTNINGVYDGTGGGEISASGYTTNHYGFININPYFGYRFKINKVRLDVLPGFDVSFGVANKQVVNVKASDNSYYNKPNIAIENGDDLRLRLGLAAYYKRYGITASGSRGFDQFARYADAYIPPEHMEIFRLGLLYKLK